jgi:hypothetical protein
LQKDQPSKLSKVSSLLLNLAIVYTFLPQGHGITCLLQWIFVSTCQSHLAVNVIHLAVNVIRCMEYGYHNPYLLVDSF